MKPLAYSFVKILAGPHHALEKFISECAWEAGFPEDVVVVPVAVSIDTIKNSPLRESVFIKTVYREGVAV